LKILIVTPRIPYPPYRGDKIKPYNLSKYLAKNHQVTLLCFVTGNKEAADIANLEKLNVKVVTVKMSPLQSFIKAILAVPGGKPLQVKWFYSSEMKNILIKLTEEENFDVIYFHLLRTAQYIKYLKNSVSYKVLDLTDAVSLYLKRFALIEKNPLKKLLINFEQNRVSRYEHIAEKFNSVFICSEVDKEYLQSCRGLSNIRILNNGVDIDYFSGDNKQYDPDKIIFTGNMPYFPNQDAAIFFSKYIFPVIIKDVPKARFYIVGQKPPSSIKKLASNNIVVTGFVPDIKKEYLSSAVNVAPMRFGAGTVNKVTESLALGVPVVSTSIAIKGLPESLQKYIFIADNPDEFAKQVVNIILNPSIRNDLMQEGKDVVRRVLGWETIVKNFEQHLLEQQILKKKLLDQHIPDEIHHKKAVYGL
jgi:polysaccharide biosynthesis protein PslH